MVRTKKIIETKIFDAEGIGEIGIEYSYDEITDSTTYEGHGFHTVTDTTIENFDIISIEIIFAGVGFNLPVLDMRKKMGRVKWNKLLTTIEESVTNQ